MNQKVDYHIHTHYSDGTDSPTKVVKWAKEQGLSVISITDHDGVGGIDEAMIAGEALDIKVIPGIELSAETGDGIGVHILGYHIDHRNGELLDACSEIREKRQYRNRKYREALAQEGYPLSEEDLMLRPDQDFIGKPIFARAMERKGYIEHAKDAFTGIFATAKMKSIKKEKISAKRAIDLIRGAGGIAVLAHPCQIDGIGKRGTQEFYENLNDLVKELKRKGLKGIECFYKDHSHEEELKTVELAEKYHLHITTGSDYHGIELR